MTNKKILVCIDAGHGGAQPGAVNGKYLEKDAALQIAERTADLLEKRGFDVLMTRETDKTLSLRQRCDISNDAGAAAFISIHLNSHTNKAAHGAETWRFTRGGALSKSLAKGIQTELILATGARDRGIKSNTTFYVLKHTIAPAAVVECGFISNSAECKKLFNPEYQDKVAGGIAAGIVKAFGK